MARLLVQLKLRLLRNALRASNGVKAAFVTSIVLAVLVAAGVFYVLARLRGHYGAVDLTTVVFTVFAFLWLIVPLVTFGQDATIDPATLALYPLRTGPLATGLLAASAAGPWPLATVIGLAGAAVGLARGPAGVAIAIIAVLLQALFCLVLARFVTTGLAGLLRSRRGRDFAVLLVIPLFGLYEAFVQIVPRLTAEGRLTAGSFAGVDGWLRWIPPGLAAHAVTDASGGHLGTALLRLALLAAVIVVLGAAWIRTLSRSLVTADTTTQSTAAHGAALPLGRYGVRGTVAARFWLYQRREPVMVLYWGIVVVIMGATSVSTIRTPNYHLALILSAVFGAAFTGIFRANTIGITGPAFGLEAMALSGRRSWRAYFSGQDAAVGVIAVPLLAAVSFGLAAVAGHPLDGFAALAMDLAGLGAALALGNICTVALPYPAERRPGNPAPRPASGYAGYNVADSLGGLAAVALLTAPVIVAWEAWHAAAGVRLPVLVLGGAAWGLALAWIGVRVAARLAEHKGPELYQIAVKSTW